ncbi:MAG: hypothetical protein ACYTEQ_01025 [Planctomycetota bacterium]|jgi:hypothetical protein
MWKMYDLMEHARDNKVEINGAWVPSRPIDYQCRSFLEKLSEAWAVFTGVADCFKWPRRQ